MTPRIIPARAGFTWAGTWGTRSSADHPRSRGVYDNDAETGHNSDGSSPLARGLRPLPARPASPRGIIPARAGFTRYDCPWRRRWADHPRSRGVYVLIASRSSTQTGSSPLARGLHGDDVAALPVVGIIPARAGFTVTNLAKSAQIADHPRSRGVYIEYAWLYLFGYGSSPLARGLPSRRRTRGMGGADHPRSRGVYGRPVVAADGAAGIIPARAGFTQCGPEFR